MRDAGIKNVVMLTGDNPSVANAIAKEVGIHEVNSELLPEQKACMHDVGISMGDIGTEVAIETADIALMTDDLRKIPQTVRLGRQTLAVIKQNIQFAMAVNIIGIILAASGAISPTLAAMIHEGNALLVVLNSARLIR